MKKHQKTVGVTDTWLTPPEILANLGSFDLDPCAAPGTRIARINMAAPALDGLTCDWNSNSMRQATGSKHPRVWCNPPFNRYERPKWMRKMAAHGNGILLIPAATETAAFFDAVWGKADAVCFVRGRPHFYHANGKRARANCGCSIALVAYGEENVLALERANLGRTIRLNKAPGPAVIERRPVPGTVEYDEETELMQEAAGAMRNVSLCRISESKS